MAFIGAPALISEWRAANTARFVGIVRHAAERASTAISPAGGAALYAYRTFRRVPGAQGTVAQVRSLYHGRPSMD